MKGYEIPCLVIGIVLTVISNGYAFATHGQAWIVTIPVAFIGGCMIGHVIGRAIIRHWERSWRR